MSRKFLPESLERALDEAVGQRHMPLSHSDRMVLDGREAARTLLRAPFARVIEGIEMPFDGHGDQGGVEPDAATFRLREGAPKLDREATDAALAAAGEVAHCVLEERCSGFEINEGSYGTVTLRLAGDPAGDDADAEDGGVPGGPITVDITRRDLGAVEGLDGTDVLGGEAARQALAPYRDALEKAAALAGPAGTVEVYNDHVEGLPVALGFEVWICAAGRQGVVSCPEELASRLREMAADLAKHLLVASFYREVSVSFRLEMPGRGETGRHGFALAALRASVYEEVDDEPELIAGVGWPALRANAAVALAAFRAAAVAPALRAGNGAGLDLSRASADWAGLLSGDERLGLALQQHGVVAGPLADPTTVLAVAPGSGIEVRAATANDEPVRLRARLGLDGLRRVLDAGLPGAGLDANGNPVDIVDAQTALGDGLWRVRYVAATPDGAMTAWGICTTENGCARVFATREALVGARREAARTIIS